MCEEYEVKVIKKICAKIISMYVKYRKKSGRVKITPNFVVDKRARTVKHFIVNQQYYSFPNTSHHK